MKNLHHDGVGYVSGRGVSKYWGVSQWFDSNHQNKRWCVKFGEPGRAANEKVFHNFVSEGFEMSESMAARIGSYFYENLRQIQDYPNMIIIPWTDDKEIRVNKKSKKIYIFKVEKTKNPVGVIEDFTEEVAKKEDNAFYTGFLAHAVMGAYLSKESLIGIKKMIEERLEKM